MYPDSKNPSFKEIANYSKQGLILSRKEGESSVDVWCRCIGRISVSLSPNNVSVSAGDWIEFDCSQSPGKGIVYEYRTKRVLPSGLSLSQWTQEGQPLTMNDIGIIGPKGDLNTAELWTASLGLVRIRDRPDLSPLTTVRVVAQAVVPTFGAGGIGDPIAWNATRVDGQQLSPEEEQLLVSSISLVKDARVTRWVNERTLHLTLGTGPRVLDFHAYTNINCWSILLNRGTKYDRTEHSVKVGQTFQALICPLPSLCHFEGVQHSCLFLAPEFPMRVAVGNSRLNFRTLQSPVIAASQGDKTVAQKQFEVDAIFPLNEDAPSTSAFPAAAAVFVAPPVQPIQDVSPDPTLEASSALFEKILDKRPEILAQLLDEKHKIILAEQPEMLAQMVGKQQRKTIIDELYTTYNHQFVELFSDGDILCELQQYTSTKKTRRHGKGGNRKNRGGVR